MKAMILNRLSDVARNPTPLTMTDVAKPVAGDHDVLLRVAACGVCHTELDEIEGRTPPPSFPIILGHQVVGRVEQIGKKVRRWGIGDRVGVAWIFSACGKCKFCLSGRENLCAEFKATGRDANGGYAEYMTVSADFAYAIPEGFSDSEAAPLLCACAVGYRSLKLANLQDGQSLGLTGFGAAGHLVLKMARFKYPNTQIFVFARSQAEQEFATELGAVWAGDTEEQPPERLDSIIDTTPVWKPVVEALRNLAPGGRLVINAIRKDDHDKDYLLRMSYHTHLWEEKEIKSVANGTRADVKECLDLAAEAGIRPHIQEYRLEDANQALYELKTSKIRGAKVLMVNR